MRLARFVCHAHVAPRPQTQFLSCNLLPICFHHVLNRSIALIEPMTSLTGPCAFCAMPVSFFTPSNCTFLPTKARKLLARRRGSGNWCERKRWPPPGYLPKRHNLGFSIIIGLAIWCSSMYRLQSAGMVAAFTTCSLKQLAKRDAARIAIAGLGRHEGLYYHSKTAQSMGVWSSAQVTSECTGIMLDICWGMYMYLARLWHCCGALPTKSKPGITNKEHWGLDLVRVPRMLGLSQSVALKELKPASGYGIPQKQEACLTAAK